MSDTEHRTTSRILDILELIAGKPEGLGLADIARVLDAPKSSLHPLLVTLVARNYLKLNGISQKYQIGEELFILGNRFVNSVELIDDIRVVTNLLSKNTSETIYFGILSGLDVLYLIKSDYYSNFRVISNPGNKLPAYSTGYGKALLSQFSAEEIRSFYPDGTLQPVTENTLKDVESLNRELEKIRQTGFAYEKEESTLGIQCIAAPVKWNSKIIAGISIAVPRFRYTNDREEQFKHYLRESVENIELLIQKKHDQWNYS